MSWGRTALSLLLLAAACRDESTLATSGDESLGQRVFQPPPGVVRAVPPYRIQSTSIGPYALGAEFKDILNKLPHGPRVELLPIERVVGVRLVRVADDTILAGIGQNNRVSFMAVLDPEIAKTEDGFGVGSEIETLREALGPERQPTGARDPRLVELDRLPNARFVVEGERVVAIVIGPEAGQDQRQVQGVDIGAADALSGGGGTPRAPGRPPPPDGDGCTTASAIEALAGKPLPEVARASKAEAVVHYGCFTGPSPEAVVVDGDEIVLVTGEPDRLRRGATHSVEGLTFASAIDADGDGRHELVAVSEKRTSEELAVRVEVLRGEGGRLISAGEDEVYRVTATAALPVARLKDIELLIEAQPGPEALEVAGFYLQRAGRRIHTLAPLQPHSMTLRLKRRGAAASSEASRAGPPSPAAASPRGGVAPRELKPAAGRRSGDDEPQ